MAAVSSVLPRGTAIHAAKSPPAPSLIRRELERALAESHGRTDDFSRGRTELARKLLALFDNSA